MIKPRHLLLWFLIATTLFRFPYPPVSSVAVAQAPFTPGSEERDRGIELFRKRNFTEAAKTLKKATSKNKLDEQSWYYLGLALTQQPKSLKDASKAFEAAIRLKPDFAAAHAALSYVLLRRNKTSEALREAQVALNFDPQLATAHYVVSVVHLYSRAVEEALKESEETIRLSPDLAAAYFVKSQALIGIYAKRILTPRLGPTPPTPEERAERRRQRKEQVAPLAEAAASLETYLRLTAVEPETELWRQQLETLKVFASFGTDINRAEAVLFNDEVTERARVLFKPEPSYTESARRAQVVGTVVLRAVFAADGTVRNILVINALPNGLTERAIKAAQLIRFTPATIDGKSVSTFIQLEYNFNLY